MITQFHGHQGRRVAGHGMYEDRYNEPFDSSEQNDIPYGELYPYSVVPYYSRKAWEAKCGPVVIVHPAKGAEDV